MAISLFLLPNTWDLVLDNNGNIATCSDIYEQAQAICTACRTMIKDMYYQQSEGIPYLEEIMGQHTYSLALYRQQLQDCALSVDGVVSADVNLTLGTDNVLSGTITFTNSEDQTLTITYGNT